MHRFIQQNVLNYYNGDEKFALLQCTAPASGRCSKCRCIKYCSLICQRVDWGNHKAMFNLLDSELSELTWVINKKATDGTSTAILYDVITDVRNKKTKEDNRISFGIDVRKEDEERMDNVAMYCQFAKKDTATDDALTRNARNNNCKHIYGNYYPVPRCASSRMFPCTDMPTLCHRLCYLCITYRALSIRRR